MSKFIFLFFFLLVACNKPDPKPELKDQIYQDMTVELGIAEKNIAEAQKQVAEHKKNLEKVQPQTGQIKFAQKRVWDAEKAVDLLEQQKKYWIIRLEHRRDYVRRKSLEAFNKKEVWSDESEFAEYQAEKRLRLAKLKWDAKQRRDDFLKAEGLSPDGNKKGGSGGEAPSSGGH
ncbi:MAG: hypothetical protein KF802_09505 [Bdellovibrionaceae bacterium]|nr:hypothetical protein [Pseudobdellovibrionaceae bacterium]MBX3033647.1 hypothetical protein [Pseudobdellovibrionaceae bacterium]